MPDSKSLTHIESLEIFKEYHPNLDSIYKKLSFIEERFLVNFIIKLPSKGDARKAYRGEQRLQEQITLLWAKIIEIIASHLIKNDLFNNNFDTLIRYQKPIAFYNKKFNKLDYVATKYSHSILGVALNFVDLIRCIKTSIITYEKLSF